MKYKSRRHFRPPVNRRANARASMSPSRRQFQIPAARTRALGLVLTAFCAIASAQGDSPTQLRQFIDQQVGGINKLKVPATDVDIPVPRMPDGTVNPRYKTTEAKRYLGKLLFHDPAKMAMDPSKFSDEQLSILLRNRETTALLTWEARLAEAKGKERDYDMAAKYRVGEIINHFSFGKGIVTKLFANKCEMLFKDRERLMASTN